MVGKYALIFVLAFCAVQGYSSAPISEPRSTIDNIIQDIDNIVTKIKNIILDFPNFINNLITDLHNKIIEAIQSIDISGTINALEDKIEEILNAAGIDVSVARGCIDAEKVSVNNLVNQTLEELDNCRITAENSTVQLEEELTDLTANALTLLTEVTGGVAKCFLDNPFNIIKRARCLTTLLVEETKKANALVIQVAQTTITASQTAVDITVTVVKCTASINKNIINGQLQIVENFETCVNEIANPEE